jgi:hypothetical protein
MPWSAVAWTSGRCCRQCREPAAEVSTCKVSTGTGPIPCSCWAAVLGQTLHAWAELLIRSFCCGNNRGLKSCCCWSAAYLDCAVNRCVEPVDVDAGLTLRLWGQRHCITGCITTGMGDHRVPLEGGLMIEGLRQGSTQGEGLDRIDRVGCCRRLLLLHTLTWPAAQDRRHMEGRPTPVGPGWERKADRTMLARCAADTRC